MAQIVSKRPLTSLCSQVLADLFLWVRPREHAAPLDRWRTRWSGASPRPACSWCGTPTRVTKQRNVNFLHHISG